MRIVIMADGKGTRWNHHLNVPKHMVEINGENLLSRTTRLLKELDNTSSFEIIVTSHNKDYEFEGCKRYEPQNNVLEIDRFTYELIIPKMCFLYGDTFYTKDSLETILKSDIQDVHFFGNKSSIVAVRINDAECFKKNIDIVRNLYLKKKISKCIGWQVYMSITNQLYSDSIHYKDKFTFVDSKTRDINTPEDYQEIRNAETT